MYRARCNLGPSRLISADLGASGANEPSFYDFFYCGQGPYPTPASLLDAIAAGKAQRCSYKPPASDGLAGGWDVPSSEESEDYKFLVPESPSGPLFEEPRFALRGVKGGNGLLLLRWGRAVLLRAFREPSRSLPIGRLIEWGEWSFFATMRPSTGLAAMDLRFRGERVAYELSLAEAAALYSGTANDQVRAPDPPPSPHHLECVAKLTGSVPVPVPVPCLRSSTSIRPTQ